MVAPGIYTLNNKTPTAMVGFKKYYDWSFEPTMYSLKKCGETSHSSFIKIGWRHIGPAEVTQW
jgi:hypothetical protein